MAEIDPADLKVRSKLADLYKREGNVVKAIEGYVPSIMCPEGKGYGDYVIMEIDGDGRIAKWRADLSDFEKPEND